MEGLKYGLKSDFAHILTLCHTLRYFVAKYNTKDNLLLNFFNPYIQDLSEPGADFLPLPLFPLTLGDLGDGGQWPEETAMSL